MTRTQRIPNAAITGAQGALFKWLSRRKLGRVPQSAGVMWQNRQVLMGLASFGQKVERWRALDVDLKTYAHMAVAAQVGCSFCLDFNYFQAHNRGLDLAKASQVPRWREATVFTPLERDVLAYAEAMTETPPRVADALSDRLLAQLGAPALLELTAVVGFANLTARSNTALGIESEGLSSVCAVPLSGPTTSYATPA